MSDVSFIVMFLKDYLTYANRNKLRTMICEHMIYAAEQQRTVYFFTPANCVLI